MIFLGIDPGTAITGFGVVREKNGKLSHVAHGVIRTPAGAALSDRLKEIHEEVASLLKEYQPDAVGVEELFFATNAKTAFTVGQARGVVLLTILQAGAPLREFTPLQVKQGVTGYGKADKTQMQKMVQMILSLRDIPKPDDAADALAIAICAASTDAFSRKK